MDVGRMLDRYFPLCHEKLKRRHRWFPVFQCVGIPIWLVLLPGIAVYVLIRNFRETSKEKV